MERKLTAILAADVVGYSRLMATDEEGTLARLQALRLELIDPTIAKHHGRIVKLMGDGVLVEFASVVDAVRCAIDIQRVMAEHDLELPEDQRFRFRIGVNLGDVIIEGEDIYGDGVNIAARLEGLAEPGGIVISGTAFDHTKKAEAGFRFIGRQQVKNIPEPVRAYQVLLDPATVGSIVGDEFPAVPARRRWPALAAAIALLVVGAGVLGWLRPWEGAEPVATEAAALDARRIAVLPFTNISAAEADEYFSDGMTEELISKLSRLHGLTVIARTSIMRYKETDKSIAEIGRELQVGTILEGSVRKAGDHLRITAQLIDVASEAHLWSQDYDRTFEDVFAIQSDVAQHVVEALQITLKPAEKRQIEKAVTDDPEAYDAYLQGLYHYSTWSKEGLEKSIDYFEQALAKDPNFAQAHAAKAFSYDILGEFGHLPLDEAFPRVKEAARRALEIDATIAEAYTVLAVVASYYDYDWPRADEGFRRALELNPNSAVTHDWYGTIYLSQLGRHEEAIAHGKRAKELDPLTPNVRSDLGWSYVTARRWDEAIAECEQIPKIDPKFFFTDRCLGLAYLHKGMVEEALAAYERGAELYPEDMGLKGELAVAYGVAGREDQAQSILDELEERAQRGRVSPHAMALAQLGVGNKDEAMRWLEKVYEERSPSLIFMNENPRYDGLRGDPRFQELLRKVGFEELKVLPGAESD